MFKSSALLQMLPWEVSYVWREQLTLEMIFYDSQVHVTYALTLKVLNFWKFTSYCSFPTVQECSSAMVEVNQTQEQSVWVLADGHFDLHTGAHMGNMYTHVSHIYYVQMLLKCECNNFWNNTLVHSMHVDYACAQYARRPSGNSHFFVIIICAQQ